LIQDDKGVTATDVTAPIAVELNSHGLAVLGGTRTRTPINGIATFDDLTVDKAGEYSLTFMAPSIRGITSTTFRIVAGAPRSVEFSVQPLRSVIRGSRIVPSIAVNVLDANANVVTTSSARIGISLVDENGSAVPLGGTRERMASNGVATFDDLVVETPGTNYTLIASSQDLEAATSSKFQVFRVAEDFALVSITVGLEQSCGLTAQGVAYCWGSNGFGELGDGTTKARSTPAPVSGFIFSSLSAGGGGYEEDISFTCGLIEGGDAYCWGGSFRGALGDGRVESLHTTPTAVVGGLKFKAISAGGAHVCALTLDGTAYCWGSNDAGELGTGDGSIHTTPTRVLGNLQFSTITAGDFHTCATTTDATYCWGAIFGALNYSSTPAKVSTSLGFTTISAGTEHTCALTSAGAAYCWGDNSTGQLGSGTSLSSASPVAVTGGRTFDVLSTKGYTACGVSDGAGYCWGWNDLGQLGAGFFTPRTDPQQRVPVRVVAPVSFRAISVGVWHACALATNGVPFCWGFNSNGQLGNDSVVESAVPIPVLR
jgi:alpha-tubulin suppressor-like RCC1 family protein